MAARTTFWPFEGELSPADAASEFDFESSPTRIIITYVSKDTYIAKTEAALSTTADGTSSTRDGRVFLKAGSTNIEVPWGAGSLYWQNAVNGEQPKLYGLGVL